MFYISQLNESDCGFASLKMLLANVYQERDYLFIKQDEERGPDSYFDLIKIAQNYNVTLEGFKFKNKQTFKDWDDFPVIVTIQRSGLNHAVTILKKKKNKLFVLDPDSSPKWVKLKDFIKFWDGTLLKVKNYDKEPSNKPQVLNFEKKIKFKFISQLVQIFISLTFLAFLFFLNDSFPPYIAVAIGGCYLIGEILFRHILIRMMDNLDLICVNKLKKVPKNSHLFLTRLNDYKQTLITDKISLISNVIMALSLIFLMVFNGYWNSIIVFAIIVLTILDSVILKPIFSKKERFIYEKEKELCNAKTNSEFQSSYSDIKKLSNKYAYLQYFKSIFILIFILLTIFVVLKVTNIVSLTSLLFYFMISLYLKKSISIIFEVQSKRRAKDLLKAKLNNLCQ